MAMTKWERMQAALSGQAVDRVPASFWGHDYAREWTADGLAAAMVETIRRYDWDWLKVNPRATYYVEDWGCRFERSDDPLRGPRMVEHAVKSASDLARLPRLDITKGAYGQQLEALRIIVKELQGETPIMQTVFSPLSVAGRLCGDASRLREYMQESPADVHAGLAVIAETLADYARACLDAGADGIFFATTEWATHDAISENGYREFGRPYDLQVLAAVRDARFNMLHVCRNNNMLNMLLDYPVHAFHWAVTGTGNPTLKEITAKTRKAVAGGVSHLTTLPKGTPEQVTAEVKAARAQTGDRRFLLAGDCSIPPDTPDANLQAAKRAAAVPDIQART